MATIQTDLDVPLDMERARAGGYDEGAVHTLFDRLEFRSLLPRLGVAFGYAAAPLTGEPGQAELRFDAAPTAATEVTVARSEAQIRELLESLRAAGRFALRTVTAGPPLAGRLLGAVVAPQGGAGTWWVPLPERRAEIESVLADADLIVDGYDLKRERLAWGDRLGARLGFDVMLGAYVDNPRARVLSLTGLAEDLCGRRLDPEETLLGSGRQKRTLEEVGEAELAAYYGEWIALVEPVRAVLSRQLAKWGLLHLHDDLELPLVPILARMERIGILVDRDMLAAISAEMDGRIAELEGEVHAAAGHAFNLGSTQQLAAVLYDELGLDAGRKTKTGRSTDADALEALREEHTVVAAVLEWRQITKLKGTYVDALPLLCDAQGRIHTSFNQAVAATGRLSSADPNLQNVPIRTQLGTAHTPFLRRRSRPGAGLRRLLADRAARARPCHRGTGADRRFRPWRGHPSPHRRAGLRHRPCHGDTGYAAGRQGRQLRGRVRAERLRPGAGHGHVPRGCVGLHHRLLRQLPGRHRVAGAHPNARPGIRLGGHLHRAAAATSPTCAPPTACSARPPSGWLSTCPSRGAPPTS